jgi:hypothetical protein
MRASAPVLRTTRGSAQLSGSIPVSRGGSKPMSAKAGSGKRWEHRFYGSELAERLGAVLLISAASSPSESGFRSA